MSERFKTTIRLLEEDLKFERDAVETYDGFAKRLENTKIKNMFLDFATDEAGHVGGLSAKLDELKSGEAEVKFYCLRCGWTLNFGKNPRIGKEVKCAMCGQRFRLKEKNGEYDIEEIKT